MNAPIILPTLVLVGLVWMSDVQAGFVMKWVTHQIAKQAFKKADQNGDGFLQKGDLQELFKEMGQPKTNEEVGEAFSVLINPETGTIDLEHFLKMLDKYKPE